jgi:GDPmannose 4,6-dehydratase
MKKVIITGATGMDGSFMSEFLLKNTDHMVLAGVRRLSNSNHKNIDNLKNNPRFKLIDLDITDSNNIEEVVRSEKPDYFINFAANSFVGNSWAMPVNHMQTNCMAVLYQLEAIRKFAPNCRYYNAGSSEEFGDVITIPQNESHPLRPRSPYGASKASARMLVKVYRDSYNLYAIQGWLFNHEGPRRGVDFVTRKISSNVARIKNSIKSNVDFEPLELGNLDAKRDWSDAEDFVKGVWLMLNQDRPKEYVLSSNETHSIREFVEEAFKIAGISGKWIFTKTADNDTNPENEVFCKDTGQILVRINPKFYRPAEVDILVGDSSLARKELYWEPKTSFRELVKKMVYNDLNI